MTHPASPRWCAELADALGDVARRVGRLAELIAVDWPDDQGRMWAERSAQLHAELERQAQAATELGRRLELAAPTADADPLGSSTGSGLHAGSGGRVGMRLGGTDGHRADDERGMRIAELPPP
jgi:hypothetical protein